MFPQSIADDLTIPQVARWHAILAYCRALNEHSGDDPYLFHGTTAMRGACIAKEGFKPSLIQTGGMGSDGTHWGAIGIAEWAAFKDMRADDPPAILAARLSDIAKSGPLAPDLMYFESDVVKPPADWRDSFERAGSICVIGGHHVPNLKRIAVAGLPLHPRAPEVRRKRLGEDYKAFAVPEGYEIDGDTPLAPDSDVALESCVIYGPKSYSSTKKWPVDILMDGVEPEAGFVP